MRSLRGGCVGALWLLCTFVAAAGVARAADAGVVQVRVFSNAGDKPVAGARVFLVGASQELSQVETTDEGGKVEFDLVPVGSYRLVVRCRNFLEVARQIDVEAGRRTIVVARISPVLRTIAAVKVTPSRIDVSTQTLSTASIPAKLSQTLLDALDDLGGVTVTRDASGAADGVSVNGRDPSLTATAFDGVQISSPLAMHALDPDLLDGVRVDQFHDTVDMLFLSPSLQLRGTSTASFGGYNFAAEKATVQGTSGSVGYAGVAALRQSSSALDGSTYPDTSGIDYEHHGGIASRSFYAAVEAPLGVNWTAWFRGIGTNSLELPIPTFFAGAVPYGFGPGLTTTSISTGEQTLEVSGTLPDRMVTAALSHLQVFERDNAANRVVAGQPFPLLLADTERSDSMSLDVSGADKWHTRARVFGLLERVTGTNLPAVDGLTTSQGQGGAFSAELTRGIRIARVLATLSITGAKNSGSNGTIGVSLEPVWVKGNATLRLRVGSLARPSESVGGGAWTDAASAQYDCAGRFVTVNGPSANGDAVRANVLDANADWRKGDSAFGLFLYDE